ncbi:MAG: LolA family protein [Planctomycetota bacterium]
MALSGNTARAEAPKALEQARAALQDNRSLRAQFVRTTVDIFGTTAQRGEVLALNPGKDKPALARVSFTERLYRKTWKPSVKHYWADEKFGYEYNVKAAVLKRYPRGTRLTLVNPKDALETFLLFIKSPENLDTLYRIDEDAEAEPDVDGATAIVWVPKPEDQRPAGADGVKTRPKLDRIVIWIDDTSHLPVLCRTELGKDSHDSFRLSEVDLEKPVTLEDIAVDVPGHVKTVDEAGPKR